MKKISFTKLLLAALALPASLASALETLVVAPASRPVTEEVVGSVRTRVRSTIEAKVSGRISDMPVTLGQKVKAGDLLVKIDAREIQARL